MVCSHIDCPPSLVCMCVSSNPYLMNNSPSVPAKDDYTVVCVRCVRVLRLERPRVCDCVCGIAYRCARRRDYLIPSASWLLQRLLLPCSLTLALPFFPFVARAVCGQILTAGVVTSPQPMKWRIISSSQVKARDTSFVATRRASAAWGPVVITYTRGSDHCNHWIRPCS